MLPAPGQPAPSLAEIAERPGIAAMVVVKAGTLDRLRHRGDVADAFSLRSPVLLLFEEPTEAADFERAVAAARETARRTKAYRIV